MCPGTFTSLNDTGALRMARFEVEFVLADMADQTAMVKATQDCEIIFHCAFGKGGSIKEQWRATVEGTRALALATLKNGVSRLINLSTAAVYGNTPDAEIDETFPRIPGPWHYAKMKLDAELVLEELGRREPLPFTTLQLTGVYGPWGEVFTIDPLRQLATSRLVLVNNGTGFMNATYVDDAVQAILRAALKPEAMRETFLIKGPGSVTRRQFYEAYSRMLGVDGLVGMTLGEIAAHRRHASRQNLRRLFPSAARALRFDTVFRQAFSGSPAGGCFQFVRPWLPELVVSKLKGESVSRIQTATVGPESRPLILPPEMMVRRLGAKTELSARKAERLLGYKPAFELDRGMALTEQWARWARLIPECVAGA